MSCEDTQQECMGWCPCERQMAGKMLKKSFIGIGDAAGGGNRKVLAEWCWWNRYHNQLLVAALLASAVAMILVSLMGSPPGSVWTALAIAAGATIGLSVSHSKRYGEIAAGKWRRGEVPAKKRLFWSMVLLALIVISLICLGWFIHEGMFDTLGMVAVGAALIYWASLAITVHWERRHRTVLIKEWGSWDAVNLATADDG
ncbi:DUF1673 family protein [Methanogenium organophilum]|uniref:DUF1673 family protein n=1 Tax=Methanogenium organophilum TaxID=2199 RepID=A0A9X9S277_METOG|nr:DUF1673 family protein [Methanogenium organophilum]WAI00216.1 DUF1673 family protein [Methanogenium organophilum]